ncbi:cytosine deaminase [Bellilinea caldifistulae]|uniref:5-methylthioadenosine/S-adenosylhomocysteine deaminase n=1 Tax=Bellilinea caldifistulae TaxID=360411 RepID=A0A0P6XGC5_9CHLR|nr:amidohydrolase family protein [Bellilinea caldifistulae]KPL73920.1 amidohydrolase [Bellilinea caldifistulae]GAP11214.1 cytosine deaminase [Bellilinea caldifistulae]
MTFSADLILKNAIVVSMDPQFNLYEPGAVVIRQQNIVAAGRQNEILQQYSAEQIMDCDGKILMPGMVNAHTHVPMTLLRGLADDLRLDVWLLGYMMPVEREFVSPDFVRLGTGLACAEMIRGGVTTFADMYYFEEDIAVATAQAGLRGICGQTVLKFPTPDAQSYEESLAYARDYIQRWKNHPLIIPAVAPHAPYTCTDEILRACAQLAIEMDVPLHIHLSETAQEVENMRREQGMPVIPFVKKLGLLDAKVIAAHCVHVDEGEMRTFQHYNTGIAHNPSSNLKLASGIAPVKKMLELGLNVGIGTDGPASNNDLDMFEEMRLASFLAKGSSGDPTALPALETLAMATSIGAKALHVGHLTGSIEAGKRADLILLDLTPVHNSPRFQRDPQGIYSQIVYAAKAMDVTDVMVNGQWLMRDRRLLTLNEEEMLREAEDYARRIDIFLIQREKSLLSKLLALGEATEEEESFEVQVKVPVESIAGIQERLLDPAFEILRTRHYREYDVYFNFPPPEESRLRYREDHFITPSGEVSRVRTRLTLLGPTREYSFPQKVLLSRSRYLATATQSLRFYREYFKPVSETEIEKERLRYLVRYQETEFFINLDHLHKPDLGNFLEIKSRTWSRKDAELKSRLVVEILEKLGASPQQTISQDYIELVNT